MSDREEAKISVPREDLTEEERLKKEEQDKQPESMRPDNTQGSVPGAEDTSDMTEEDRLLKEKLNDLVKELQELLETNNKDAVNENLTKIRSEIQTSTSSMTSVPKPLKFLRPHLEFFKQKYETLEESNIKVGQ
jgi:26S proteasome regulatory subunit N1